MSDVRRIINNDKFSFLFDGCNQYKLFCLLFIAFMLLFLYLSITPGTFASDDIAYLLTVHSLAKCNRLWIWNGLDEINATELSMGPLREINGNLYGLYSPFHPFLAYPFYKVFGYKGLFLLNLLAHILTLYLLYRISALFHNDEKFTYLTVITYSIFTFALQYSIDLWPHSISIFLVLSSVYFLLRFYLKLNDYRILFLSGFLSGMAIGVRYVNAIFSIVLFLFIVLKMQRKSLIYFTLGFLIPISYLLLIHQYAFGNIFETNYGNILSLLSSNMEYVYLPLLILMLIVVAYFHKKYGLNREYLIALLVLFFISVLTLQMIGINLIERIESSAKILYYEIVDMTPLSDNVQFRYKKSLLQSDPIFILAILSPFLIRKKTQREMTHLFISIILIDIFFFSTRMHHGGGGYNMRYLLETVPFLTLLSSYTIYCFISRLGTKEFLNRNRIIIYASLFLITIISIIILSVDENVNLGLNFYSKFSLILTAILFISFYLYFFVKLDRIYKKKLKSILLALLVISYSCCFLMSFHDLAAAFANRNMSYEITNDIGNIIKNNSAIIYFHHVDVIPVAPVKLEKNVRVAYCKNISKINETLRLIDFWLDNDIDVYLVGEINGNRSTSREDNSTMRIQRNILYRYEYNEIESDKIESVHVTLFKILERR